MYKLLERLSEICAPSGFETPIAEALAELIGPYADSVTHDTLGNLIAIKHTKKIDAVFPGAISPKAKRLMLCAHMDEVGFIITGHEKGFLRFSAIGGIDPRTLPARALKILADEPVYGVIDVLPPHLLSGADMDKGIDVEDLYIDVGLGGERAEGLIPPGTPAVFAEKTMILGKNNISGKATDDKNICVSGKAMDDRACCAMIIRAFEALDDWESDTEIIALFSVQEELGMRGAKTGAFNIEPHIAVVLDVTHADTPDAKPEETQKFGGGAAIGVGPNISRKLSDRLVEIAKAKAIPHQIEVLSGNSGTDGWEIQVSRCGVPTALISLPVKYMHTPTETLLLDDFAACQNLLIEFIKSAGEAMA